MSIHCACHIKFYIKIRCNCLKFLKICCMKTGFLKVNFLVLKDSAKYVCFFILVSTDPNCVFVRERDRVNE